MFKDKVITNVVVHFSFCDRLRILIGKKALIQVIVDTENEVGEVSSKSTISVEPVFKVSQNGAAYIADA